MDRITDDLVRIEYEAGRRDFTELVIVGAAGGVATFDDAQLDGCDFSGAELIGAHFRGASLRSVFFAEATLTSAKFNAADLEGAVFAGAWAEQANFVWATLWNTDLKGYFGFSAFTLVAQGGGPSFDAACSWPERPVAFACATLDEQPFWEAVEFYNRIGPVVDDEVGAVFEELAALRAERSAVVLESVRGGAAADR